MAKIGRPTKYNDTFPLLAEGYAREGMKDKEIAKKLGISKARYYIYQSDFRDFRDSIRKGKAPVDFEVENALLKRAMGFEVEETVVEYVPVVEGMTPAIKTVKKTKKLVVPDVTAQKFWLTNRKREKWKDRQDLDVNANMNITVISAVPRPKRKGKKNGRQ